MASQFQTNNDNQVWSLQLWFNQCNTLQTATLLRKMQTALRSSLVGEPWISSGVFKPVASQKLLNKALSATFGKWLHHDGRIRFFQCLGWTDSMNSLLRFGSLMPRNIYSCPQTTGQCFHQVHIAACVHLGLSFTCDLGNSDDRTWQWEKPPFMNDCPIKSSMYRGCPVITFDCRRVYQTWESMTINEASIGCGLFDVAPSLRAITMAQHPQSGWLSTLSI